MVMNVLEDLIINKDIRSDSIDAFTPRGNY